MGRLKSRPQDTAGKISERPGDLGSYMDEPPKFSLRHVQKSHCINNCTKDERLDFVQAMFRRKDISWKELLNAPHGGIGYEPIRAGFRVVIPDVAQKESIISFRFSGKKAMVGFRERDVFYVLWFDTKFDVYKH